MTIALCLGAHDEHFLSKRDGRAGCLLPGKPIFQATSESAQGSGTLHCSIDSLPVFASKAELQSARARLVGANMTEKERATMRVSEIGFSFCMFGFDSLAGLGLVEGRCSASTQFNFRVKHELEFVSRALALVCHWLSQMHLGIQMHLRKASEDRSRYLYLQGFVPKPPPLHENYRSYFC